VTEPIKYTEQSAAFARYRLTSDIKVYADFVDARLAQISVYEPPTVVVVPAGQVWLAIHNEYGQRTVAHLNPSQARIVRDALDAWLATAEQDT
jgi:hypothetical protein